MSGTILSTLHTLFHLILIDQPHERTRNLKKFLQDYSA